MLNHFKRWSCWIFPSACAGCGDDVAGGFSVCAPCGHRLAPAAPAPTPPHLQRFCAIAAFECPLRDIVLSFKYRGRGYLDRILGEWMAMRGPAWMNEASLVVPVPAPWGRRVWRGYHPAELLGAALAQRLGRPWAPRALRRRHGFPSQTRLNRDRREINAFSSFTVGRSVGRVAGQRVLLVDDVSTTGATLAACAKLLRDAGAKSVDAVVLAQEALGARP